MITYNEFNFLLDEIIRVSVESAYNSIEVLYGEKTCLACGSALSIEARGRRKYCASCGCYLPEIIYDTTFTESVNPMESVKAPYMPTISKPQSWGTVKTR